MSATVATTTDIKRSRCEAGMLTYGPYVPLRAGHYIARIFGEVRAASDRNTRLASDVIADTGRRILSKRDRTL